MRGSFSDSRRFVRLKIEQNLRAIKLADSLLEGGSLDPESFAKVLLARNNLVRKNRRLYADYSVGDVGDQLSVFDEV